MIDLIGKLINSVEGRESFKKFVSTRFSLEVDNILVSESGFRSFKFDYPYSYFVSAKNDRDNSYNMVFANDGTVRYRSSGNVLSSDFVEFLAVTLKSQGVSEDTVYKALVKNSNEIAKVQKSVIDEDRDRNIRNIARYLGKEVSSKR